MATKSKNIGHETWVKVAAGLLVVILVSAFIFSGMYMSEKELSIYAPKESSFFDSYRYEGIVRNKVEDLERLIYEFKSRENVESGGTITPEDLEQKLRSEFSNSDYRNSYNYYEKSEYQKEELYKKFKEERQEQIRQAMIQSELYSFENVLRRLNKEEGFYYYAHLGESTFSNIENPSREAFGTFPFSFLRDGFEDIANPPFTGQEENSYSITISSGKYNYNAETRIYIGFSEGFFTKYETEWKEGREFSDFIIPLWVLIGLGTLALMIYLTIFAGRKEKSAPIHFNYFDRIYLDVNAAVAFGVAALGISGAYALMFEFMKDEWKYVFAALAVGAAVLYVLMFYLSLVKHIKDKSVLRHTLIVQVLYWFVKKFWRVMEHLFTGNAVRVKGVLLVLLILVLTALSALFFPITILIIIGMLYVTVKVMDEYLDIKKGTEEIKNGNIDYEIDIKKKRVFKPLAEDINSLKDGLEDAVNEMVKSDKMRTELVTNVSHDIRTPLTSILNYSDLLQKEGIQSENAEKYIEIIKGKAQRLKVLTDDLFEVSKATSGNVSVDLTKIEVSSLIDQLLGEHDDRIREHNLDFIVSKENEKYYVMADGRHFSRVFENIFSNLFKYALEGSRVYIDMKEEAGKTVIEIKNISKFALNIDAEELMQRFTRGDSARSTEGSGLGLAIAASLMELQKGELKLVVDGDLFKAVVMIPSEDKKGI